MARAPGDGPASGRAHALLRVTVPGVTVFLGAFLLFAVQLVLAKTILPRFGGAPAVWTSCVLFFQALLVLGYAYAHAAARRLSARMQAGLHLVLLGAALCTLPLAPPARAVAGAPAGETAPVLEILAWLARCVALPAFVLCASSPLLAAWVARGAGEGAERAAPREGAGSPYRLYAFSNAGSMLALLAYPLVFEPWLTTRVQEYAWSGAFLVFALLSAWCAWALWRAPDASGARASEAEVTVSGAGWRASLLWLALPACATTLLLAVTNQLCQEVAVVPLLWVVPLALYLLSFILCFARERWYRRTWCLPVLILALGVMAQTQVLGARAGPAYALPVDALGLFVCCVFCHGELAARRPAPRHLTAFYLLSALGGLLGGVFVSLLAPLLFKGFDELYVGLCACGALAVAFSVRDPAYRGAGRRAWHPLLTALIGVVLVIGLLLGGRIATRARAELTELRDFYGILRIEELRAPDGNGTVRYLTHGGTRHGQQFQDPARRAQPTTYYGHASGIGLLLDAHAHGPALRVGIVGLGAGVLASYGRAGDRYRFYELSPRVIEVATHTFTFLADCAATTEIVAGDARLALEREPAQGFDVLVLDAFSSDAIPVHLLTREAFALYAQELAPAGVLALHVTTRHLDLGPLIHVLAADMGLSTWEIVSRADDELGTLDARWILLSKEPATLELASLRAAGHALAGAADPPRAWTDDYSDLLAVLK